MAHRLLYWEPMTKRGGRSERVSRRRRSGRPRRETRGFTLVELAVVVVIVGVLAVIAVVSYRKLINASKITEATTTISSIRLAQEHYFDLRSTYARINGAWCPGPGGTAQKKTMWDSQCGSPQKWEALAPHVDGPVQFGYKTDGGDGRTVAFSNNGLTWVDFSGQSSLTKPWYVIYAQADLDGTGGNYTELATSNATNQIFSRNVGE